MTARVVCLAAAGALAVLAGCSPGPRWEAAPEPQRALRAERERDINAAWLNQPVRALMERWGPPRQLLDIPGGGNPPGFVLVYPRDTASGCVDTFAAAYGPVTRVRSYQCR